MKSVQNKKVRSKVNFARTYPFYLKLGANQAFSFSVTISAQKKINPVTGMSVDLIQLDQIAKKVLKTKKVVTGDIVQILKGFVHQLQKLMVAEKSQLVRVEFDESRGSAYVFVGRKILFCRQDFAQDNNGDLYKVKSFFNQKNELIRLNIINLKLKTEEHLIF